MANFPPQLLVTFGMENMDFSSVLGFFGLIFLFCQICLAIQAANYGFGLVSVEESEWTADFLLAKPVSRTKIMTSQAAGGPGRPDHHQYCRLDQQFCMPQSVPQWQGIPGQARW